MIVLFYILFFVTFGTLGFLAFEHSRGVRLYAAEARGHFDAIVCSFYSRMRPYKEIFSKNTVRFLSKIVLAFLVKTYFALKKWFVTKEEALFAKLHTKALRTRRGSISFVLKSVSDHRKGLL